MLVAKLIILNRNVFDPIRRRRRIGAHIRLIVVEGYQRSNDVVVREVRLALVPPEPGVEAVRTETERRRRCMITTL